MLGMDIQLSVDLMLGKGIPETQSVVSGVAYVKELRGEKTYIEFMI